MKLNWDIDWALYRRPEVWRLLVLGFAAGLPYLLVFSTLTAWLTDAGTDLTDIGLLSQVGLLYSVKYLWAMLIEQLPLGALSRKLGRRRSWLLLSQLGVTAGLVGLALCQPQSALWPVTLLALLVAWSSATQDILIDAYRIEIGSESMQSILAASYTTGYRIAMLVAGAGALYLAEYLSWNFCYLVMAFAMLPALWVVWAMPEPVSGAKTGKLSPRDWLWLPIADFFSRYGRYAWWLLAFILCYRLSDLSMGNMTMAFYLKQGYSKIDIANIAKVFGFGMTIIGSFLGSYIVLKLGLLRTLQGSIVLTALTNLGFAWLAGLGINKPALTLIVSLDNLAAAVASVAFVAFLSKLTSREYTATQYALFSSIMTLLGKLIGGYSGYVVKATSFETFFVYTALLGLPAWLLCLYLSRHADLVETDIQSLK